MLFDLLRVRFYDCPSQLDFNGKVKNFALKGIVSILGSNRLALFLFLERILSKSIVELENYHVSSSQDLPKASYTRACRLSQLKWTCWKGSRGSDVMKYAPIFADWATSKFWMTLLSTSSQLKEVLHNCQLLLDWIQDYCGTASASLRHILWFRGRTHQPKSRDPWSRWRVY
jgi:hypothetical protein